MKKMLLLAFALIAAGQVYSQSALDSDIDFYGVDFGLAKAYGVDESFYNFEAAFERINLLMISEAKKYNVCRFFSKNNVEIMVDTGIEASRKTNESDFRISTTKYTLDDDLVARHIRTLDIDPVNPVGMIVLAEFLNKPAAAGFWRIIFFDTATKEILAWKSVVGKAGGFGLRNYWANSIYNAFKSWSYTDMQVPY